MKILLITYYFPPVDFGATNRLMRLLPFMRDKDIELYVVTVEANSRISDETLIADIGAVKRIVRTKQFLPSRRSFSLGTRAVNNPKHGSNGSGVIAFLRKTLRKLISIPDANVGWYPFGKSQAVKLTRNIKFDLIFSTSPSRTVHLIARTVHRTSKIPWVADFRDSWFDYGKKDFWLKNFINRRILNSVIREADELVFTSKNLKEYYSELFPQLSHKLHFVPHGIESVDTSSFEGFKNDTQEFWIGYVGSMDRLRTPYHFLEILSQIRARRPEIYNRIRVKMVGTFTDEYRNVISAHGCADKVDFVGFVPRIESLHWMFSCDCLLILLSDVEWIGLGACASKIYDYLALKKPVLGLVPYGFVYDLIRKVNAGGSFSSAELAQAVDWLIDLIEHGQQLPYDLEQYEKLKVANVAHEFYEIMQAGSKKIDWL